MKKVYLHFFPRRNGERGMWLDNYSEKIPVAGPGLGHTPQEITSLTDAAQNHRSCLTAVEVKTNELAQARKALRLSFKTDMKLIIDAAVAAKRKPGYNEALADELGIIGTRQAIDLATVRPTLKLAAYPGYVEVSFLLQGLRGITIYSRIKGTLGWEQLSHDYESPYKDTRPLMEANKPEIREYIARYFNGREDIGRDSDVAVITYGG